MGSGWHEWPLVLFTVLGQCVAGGLIVTGQAWFNGNQNDRARIVRVMFFLWVLMGIAFLASVMHLGSPLRAFNSLNRLGDSPLSNEIASGSLFFAVGGLWWLVAVLGKMPEALGKAWLIVAMALGALFIFAMTRVYQINTVPTWHNGYTTPGFFLTAFLGGPLLGALLLAAAGVAGSRVFTVVCVLALVISLAGALMQSASLAGIHTSVQQASALLPDYGFWQAWRMALLALGIGCWLCPLIRRVPPHPWGLTAGFTLVLAGELIGRGLFYGLHMTVGMTVAG
ncbi:dimethyl sulfoxide reductase anchor subunit family protein [Cronobacter muytjensii]|uniref:Dimethylsulfoxide reductase n=1 Tax=Cronobacter muytjensii TaxID=413501 RepID=A0A2T7ATA6_9ENTR|nr:dimethyl sulfoxide reductase anchor subunit family protein [Cronobacter muytjensii]KAB0885670.1 dimethylsulfoxide reductase [Cronobacter muytjensii]MBF4811386.1 dimethyl sulfoxide reductase anchor subunit family protein [Cronobacter muytjensii]PUX14749.1 dimethylsulfoxide reductase [Cronobacter muytjensii]